MNNLWRYLHFSVILIDVHRSPRLRMDWSLTGFEISYSKRRTIGRQWGNVRIIINMKKIIHLGMNTEFLLISRLWTEFCYCRWVLVRLNDWRSAFLLEDFFIIFQSWFLYWEISREIKRICLQRTVKKNWNECPILSF